MTPERLKEIKEFHKSHGGLGEKTSAELIAHAEQTVWRSVDDELPPAKHGDKSEMVRVWGIRDSQDEDDGERFESWEYYDHKAERWSWHTDEIYYWQPIIPPEGE